MSHIVELLKEDHKMTMKAWPIVYRVIMQMKQDQEVPCEAMSEIIQFINGFVLEHHFPLEEVLLETAMTRGVDQEHALVGKVIVDHVKARNYVEILSETLQFAIDGDESAREEFADESAELIDFLLRHEAEEDAKLFPFMSRVLTEDDEGAIASRVITAQEDEQVHQHFRQLLQKIETDCLP